MNLDQFDLNLLVALDALLTEKNVTHAGIRIHLSQSAMSGALARLRDFFHDELLVPVGRRMVLTPLAQSLVKPVRSILLQVQATVATKPRFDPTTSKRHFSLGLSDYMAVVFMAGALQDIQRQAPNITFDLRPATVRNREALESGTLDFFIGPDVFSSESHPRMVLLEDSHTCIAWARNSRIGDKISLEDYLNLGHVTVHIGEGQSPNFDERFLRPLNYKRKVEVVTHSFSIVPYLVVGTNRIGTVTTRLAVKYAQFLPLKLVPVPVELPPMVEVLQWHKHRDQDPAYIWFRETLKEAAARLPGPPGTVPEKIAAPAPSSARSSRKRPALVPPREIASGGSPKPPAFK